MNSKLSSLKHLFISICLLGACSNEKVSQQNIPTEPCDCAKTFDELVVKLESNYVGLALITDTKRLANYDSLKKDFSSRSKDIDPSGCTQFLGNFLSFFEDGHLSVIEFPRADSVSLSKNKQFLQNEAKNLEEINELAKDTSDQVIGLWSDGESVFRMVKNQSYFDAYLVKSNRSEATVGSLKMRLQKTPTGYEGSYHPYDYNSRFVKGDLYKEGQVLKMGVTWNRVSAITDELQNVKQPSIQRVDDTHSVLTIPSFSFDYDDFQDFLKANKKVLKETEHLIIDIRGNTGGNTIYFPLIKYFATHDLQSKQGYVLSSEDNRAYFKRFISVYSKVYSPLIDRMSEDGKVVGGPIYAVRKFSPAKNKIQQVSILTDRGCASAAESFILHSKGSSDKVKTFGSPTRGMIDFTSKNSLMLKNSGWQRIFFGYPTGTLHKDVMENGYNKTGIIPDKPIESSKNKIQFVIDSYDQTRD